MKTITSMSRFRFKELRQGILDGSLAEKWKPLESQESTLTKSQQVELRQIDAILAIYEQDPQVLTQLVGASWRELRIVERPNGIFAEVVR